MGVAEFRAELAETIEALGISCPTYLPAVPDPPCALVDYEVGEAIAFQHGAYETTWRVGLCHPFVVEDAQVWFDSHKDPSNTSGLFRTLMDASWTYADYVKVTGAGLAQYQVLEHAGEVLIVDFTLEVVL